MKKLAKIKRIIDSGDSNDVKSAKIKDVLNEAVQTVLNDLWIDLKTEVDEAKLKVAERKFQVLAGQATNDDYPDV